MGNQTKGIKLPMTPFHGLVQYLYYSPRQSALQALNILNSNGSSVRSFNSRSLPALVGDRVVVMRMVVPIFVPGGMRLFDSRILVVLVFALRIEPVFPTICTGIKRIRYVTISRSEFATYPRKFRTASAASFQFYA